MSEEKNCGRGTFRNCGIFTAERSLSSIINACDFERTTNTKLRVLDAFAGEGIVADAIANELTRKRKKYSIAVAEINPNHLKKVCGNYRQLCLDLCNNQIERKYSLIVIRYGLHDLFYGDKEKALRNLVYSLKRKGRIVINDIMPDENSKKWLEMHHQQKEALTKGPNGGVCLSSPRDYIGILKDNGVQAEITDSFYQEVFIREWVSTYGASKEAVSILETLTLQAPIEMRDKFMVFNHPKRGARIYFPIVTIAGVKNE